MTAMRGDLYEEALAYFNEPVLIHLSVVRLIGYGETAIDCYWIMNEPGKGVYWSSCVGGFMSLRSLKEQGVVHAHNGEVWTDYTRLDSWLSLNGAPKLDNFLVELRHDDEERELFGCDVGAEVIE